MQIVERVRPHHILIAQKQQDKVPSLVKSVPTPSVNSTANSAPSVNSNQSINIWPKEKCVKQLVLRKEIQKVVQRSEPYVPKIPPGNGNNNKAVPKVSDNKPLTLKQVYRKATHSEDPLEKGNQTQDTHSHELT